MFIGGSRGRERPRIVVLYHYLYPDDVVSARHFDGLCLGLVERGWDVESMPCNRGCRDEAKTYPRQEAWRGVRINRVWRPAFKQSHPIGRVLNSGWMLANWSALGNPLRRSKPDVVLIGTDPALSVLAAPPIKTLFPGVKVAHWAYDLYPEAPIADGLLDANSMSVRLLKRALSGAYQHCDLVADLGPCMRRLISDYGAETQQLTLTPWALKEPESPPAADPDVRRELFGDAKVGVLYSGNFGRAHFYEQFLALARRLRDAGVAFCFSVRGNCEQQLRQAVRDSDTNIRFAGFVDEAGLEKRLASADIHLASLRPSWTGVVVPSKFFGSLAVGRPVMFAGEESSALARWIREYQVGWVLSGESIGSLERELRALTKTPGALRSMQQRCHDVYQREFSQERIVTQWDDALRALV